jgi:predicted HTH transcriptional regulator
MDESLWSVDRFEDFLAERRRPIAEGINEFMESLIAEEPEPLSTIEDLIARGESLGVEYKSSLRWDYRENQVNKALTKVVAKTLAAFMNSQGGTLLIGVADDGEVVGLDKDFETLGSKGNRDGFELTFRNSIGSYLGEDKNPFVELTFSEIDGQTVAVASCQQHRSPVFVEDGDRSEFYVRAGNTSRPLDVKEASEYIKSHWAALAPLMPG